MACVNTVSHGGTDWALPEASLPLPEASLPLPEASLPLPEARTVSVTAAVAPFVTWRTRAFGPGSGMVFPLAASGVWPAPMFVNALRTRSTSPATTAVRAVMLRSPFPCVSWLPGACSGRGGLGQIPAGRFTPATAIASGRTSFGP